MSSPSPQVLDGRDLRIAVIRSRFNDAVTRRLLEGARRALQQARVADRNVQVLEVPGAVELPLAADLAIGQGGVDAVVCLGAVIRGATSHFEHVCRLAADGIQRVMLERRVPVAFGVLTCDTLEQAQERSGSGSDNRGFDAACAAVEMALLQRRLRRVPSPSP